MPPKKFIILTFLLTISLSACDHREVPIQQAENTKHPIFLKEGISDRQMIRDLNLCARQAFKESIEKNASGSETQTKCMDAKGYDISYN